LWWGCPRWARGGPGAAPVRGAGEGKAGGLLEFRSLTAGVSFPIRLNCSVFGFTDRDLSVLLARRE